MTEPEFEPMSDAVVTACNRMAFYADSGGNRQDWQAHTFLMAVVDKDSGFSFLNRRMKPVVVESLRHV